MPDSHHILKTKFFLPPLPSDFVYRSALYEKASKLKRSSVLLISAPSGYGKSVFAASWIRKYAVKHAWLSLAETENDLQSFMRYLTDNLYAIANISDAGSMPTQPLETFKTFFTNNDYFKSIELGWVSSKKKFYHDNIHLNFWHSDGSDVTASLPGWGFVYSATHYFANKWLPFIRGGFARDGGTLLHKSLNAGTSFQNSQGAG